VRFAFVFGGYFDLRHALRYVLTGAYHQAGLCGTAPLPTRADDRWKFLNGNLDLLPPASTRDRCRRLLEDRIADPAAPADPAALSEPERALWRLIDNRDPARFEALYAAAMPYIEPWVRALSPATVAAQITTPLLIVHSQTDPKTHYSESLALSRAVTNSPESLLAIVNIFSHVDLSLGWRSLARLRREVVPGLLGMWPVVVRVMAQLRGPASSATPVDADADAHGCCSLVDPRDPT
jgi:hypothetical protein